VEDGGDRRSFIWVGGVMLGAEACQIRHGISVRLPSGGGNDGKWVGRACSAKAARVRRRAPPALMHFDLKVEAFVE
jgi:hypothetical protein